MSEQQAVRDALLAQEARVAFAAKGERGAIARFGGFLFDTFLSVVGLGVFYVLSVYQTYNTVQMGHMIDVLDQLHSDGKIQFSGMHAALAAPGGLFSGLFRALFFFDQATVPLALVTAFSSTGVGAQGVVLADPAAAASEIQAYVENFPQAGVDEVVCKALKLDTAACLSDVCKDPASKTAQIAQSALNMGLGGAMGGSMVANALTDEAGPAGAVVGMLIGGIGGAVQGASNARCFSSKCPC